MSGALQAVRVCRKSWRALVVLNVAYAGFVVAGFVFAAYCPQANEFLLQSARQAFTGKALSFVGEAYASGNVLRAVLITFAVNLILGTFVEITIPSLIVPFSGMLVACARAFLWGIVFQPQFLLPGGLRPLLSLLVLLVLEGEAYVVAMLAVFVHGRALVRPASVGAATRWEGYRAGLKITGWLYLAVIALLALAAIYEVAHALLLSR